MSDREQMSKLLRRRDAIPKDPANRLLRFRAARMVPAQVLGTLADNRLAT